MIRLVQSCKWTTSDTLLTNCLLHHFPPPCMHACRFRRWAVIQFRCCYRITLTTLSCFTGWWIVALTLAPPPVLSFASMLSPAPSLKRDELPNTLLSYVCMITYNSIHVIIKIEIATLRMFAWYMQTVYCMCPCDEIMLGSQKYDTTSALSLPAFYVGIYLWFLFLHQCCVVLWIRLL